MATQQSIIMYGAQWCAYCVSLRSYLDAKHIAYEYKDVDNKDVEKQMLNKTDGTYLIPAVIIGDMVYHNPSGRQIEEYIQ